MTEEAYPLEGSKMRNVWLTQVADRMKKESLDGTDTEGRMEEGSSAGLGKARGMEKMWQTVSRKKVSATCFNPSTFYKTGPPIPPAVFFFHCAPLVLPSPLPTQ